MLDQSLSKVEGLPTAGRFALESRSLKSTADVWAAMGQDERLIDKLGLENLTAQIRSSLAVRAKQESQSITASVIGQHLADILVAAGVLALGLTCYLAHRHRLTAPEKVVVSAATNINPFYVLVPADLDVHGTPNTLAANNAMNRFIGPYPTTQVLIGKSLDVAPLSSGRRLAQDLDGLRILSTKVLSTPLLAGVRQPVRLQLFLPSHSLNTQSTSQLFSVYLLDFKPAGVVLVTVIAADVDTAAKLLSAPLDGDLVAVGPIQ